MNTVLDDNRMLTLANAASYELSWLHAVHDNLTKLANHSDLLSELRGGTVKDFFAVAQRVPGLFRKTIQKALSLPSVNKSSFWCVFKEADFVDPLAPLAEFVKCNLCAYECKTVQGMNWHRARAHASKHPLRRKIEGTVCCACISEFYTRARLLRHVSR